MNRTMMTAVLAGLAFLIHPHFAGAANYYVDATNGSDSNSGSITSPWKYVDTSAVKLQPGDTLYVRGGTYTLSPTNSWGVMYLETRQGADGAAGAIKSIVGYTGETAILNFPIQQQASYWRWEGLTITQSMEVRPWDPWSSMTIPAGNTPPMAHEVPGLWPHDIQIIGNTFKVAPIGQWSGVLQTFGSNLLIENNDFTQSRPGSMTSPQNQTTGLYVSSGDNIIVRGNRIAGPSDYISEVYDERRASSEVFTRWITNVLIENNIYYCPPGGLTAVNGDPYVSRGLEIGTGNYTKGNNITVRNNVFFGMKEELIQLDQGYDNVKIYNNTFFQPNSGTILSTRQFSSASTNVSVENNIFDLGANYSTTAHVTATTGWVLALNNNLYYPSTPKISGTTEQNAILGDPLFASASGDPTLANFHLQSGSAAIDKGLTLAADVPGDKDGICRPQGAGFDIGAYEFCASGSCPATCGSGSGTIANLLPPAPPRGFRLQ